MPPFFRSCRLLLPQHLRRVAQLPAGHARQLRRVHRFAQEALQLASLFLPEQLGGLPTPRTPAERIEDRVMTKDGRDVTAEYRHGAEQALHLARLCGCKIALLKERSPSCGSGTIYDGTFTGGLTAGDGVTAALLRENGITVYGESEIGRLLEEHGQPMEAMF